MLDLARDVDDHLLFCLRLLAIVKSKRLGSRWRRLISVVSGRRSLWLLIATVVVIAIIAADLVAIVGVAIVSDRGIRMFIGW